MSFNLPRDCGYSHHARCANVAGSQGAWEALNGYSNSSEKARPAVSAQNIESDLASRFLRVVEVAAIASAHTMGQGERKLSDQVATEAMRQTMDCIPMRGTIVIGEGERDEAPMLYIGEKVGAGISRRTRSA